MSISDKHTANIVFGDVASSALKQAFNFDINILVQRDILSAGYVLNTNDITSWVEQRSKHWAVALKVESTSNFFSDPNDLYNNLDKLKEYENIILWSGYGLEEQLLKILIVNLCDTQDIDVSKIKIIQYPSTPNSTLINSTIGVLTTKKLRAHPVATPLSQTDILQARKGWDAYTYTSPQRLSDFLEDQRMRGSLQQAMRCLLRRFPNKKTGLTYHQTKLLEACVNGSTVANIMISVIAAQDNRRDFVHEQTLFAELNTMLESDEQFPLLENQSKGDLSRTSQLKMTADALNLISNTKDETTFGYDYWLGGIHFKPSTNHWFANKDFTKLVKNP